MKLIELHILQSYPVSCLNRDDVGSPKSAIFGGTTRARISSQCLKRATRMAARDSAPAQFGGVRSRLLKEPFSEALRAAGAAEAELEALATTLCETFSKIDSKDKNQVTTAVYLSPSEIEKIATDVAAGTDPKRAVKNAVRLDAADIALFGRMVANDASLNIEGAAMFSHALSTHKSVNEVDFYSAVDDRKAGAEDAGAGMIGTLEYVSATYYRYVAVNLDLLATPSHLGELEPEDRRKVLANFLRAAITSVPSARRNSMNASTMPSEVLATFKERGQPIQLINAFEAPIAANGEGYSNASIAAMKAELERMKKLWDVETAEEIWLSETGLKDLVHRLSSHAD